MPGDPMAELFIDFKSQESYIRDQITDILDRAVDEARLTRCQVAGVLMDLALNQLGRPFDESGADYGDDKR